MSAHKFAAVVFALGTLAGLGNYLWLIGVLPQPSHDLMEARWIYQSVCAFIAVICYCISLDQMGKK